MKGVNIFSGDKNLGGFTAVLQSDFDPKTFYCKLQCMVEVKLPNNERAFYYSKLNQSIECNEKSGAQLTTILSIVPILMFVCISLVL